MELPTTAAGLETLQERLARARPPPYQPDASGGRVAATFVCFGRGGHGPGNEGDIGWAGAAVLVAGRLLEVATTSGSAGAPYRPGLLALREAALLVSAVEHLRERVDLLLVNATGRDHPRRAGLAVHLGAHLAVPSIGVTHRPLLAEGKWPDAPEKGARAPLMLDDGIVGYWVRTRPGCRPLAVHAGWRTNPEQAVDLTLQVTRLARTPEPLRHARRLARQERSRRSD